jgi:hypothetical protein
VEPDYIEALTVVKSRSHSSPPGPGFECQRLFSFSPLSAIQNTTRSRGSLAPKIELRESGHLESYSEVPTTTLTGRSISESQLLRQ